MLSKTLIPEFSFQMAHLVSVKSHGSSMTGSQSLHDQSSQGVSAFQEGLSPHRPPMPRQNSDPTSETPAPPPRITSRDEKFDRSSWLRQEDGIPPKVIIWDEMHCSCNPVTLIVIHLEFMWNSQQVDHKSFLTESQKAVKKHC